MFRIITILAVYIACATAPLFAADPASAGGGGALAPVLPASASLHGRGTVSSPGAMDASDVSRLTANSALAGGTQVIAGQAEREGGAKVLYGAAALPVFYSGTVGFFARNESFGELPAANAFGVSAAGYNSEHNYGIGGHLSFTAHGGKEQFAGFGFNLRIDPAEAFSGHAYFINSGIYLRDNETSAEKNPVNQFGIIANYYPLRDISSRWGLDLGAGLQKTGDGPFVLGASAEAGIGKLLFARLGYENPVDSRPDASGLSAGAGFLYDGFGIDGAYRFASNDGSAGGVWSANVKYEIERLKTRRASENFALAQEYFGKKRYGRAARYSRRAIGLDSTRWDARALLHKSNAEARRKGNSDIAIIYGGNTGGVVIPYPPSPDALGGLSRYAAVVGSLRGDNPVNFSIDVGNMLSADNHRLTVELAAKYYDLMKFDMIAPGGGVLEMGPFKFMAAQKRPLPAVITNLNDNNAAQTGISSAIMLTNDGYSIYLINLVAKSAVSDSVTLNTVIDIGSVKALLKGQNASKANLRAAVIHGNMNDIKRLAAEFTELDLIIAGSLEERLEAPLMAGRTLVVSAGSGNRFAGCLTLRFDNGKSREGRFTAENKLYPVFQDIDPDPEIENITKLVSAAIKVERSAGGNISVRVRGVIPHLSDRGHGTQAFVKAVESRGEYHLGEEIINSRRPAFSPASNRGAFIYGKSELMNGKLRMVDLGTMNGRTLTPSGKNVMEAAFSPADNFIYYIEADSGSENGAIYRTRMYMFDALPILAQDGRARRDLSVSDDGATILYCAKGDGNRWHIYAADTSAALPPTRITGGNADHRYPRLSPNGKFIAYLSDRDAFGIQPDLWIYDRDRQTHKRLTVSANAREFSWSDDSETIYLSSGANITEISGISVRDGEAKRLIAPPNNAPKTWSENTPRFIRYGGMPKIVYTREHINGTRRIYWYDVLGQRDEKVYVTGENEEWLE